MLTALKCPHCSAALPTPTPGAAYLQCSFCGGTAQLGVAAPAPGLVQARVAESVAPGGPTRDDVQRFVAAFNAAVAGGEAFVAALQTAARGTLAGFGDQTAMTFAVAHLAVDFERESGAKVRRDGQVVSRLTEAYYKAAVELTRTASTEINLPFLTATESGPKHLSRAVTAAELAGMVAGPPVETGSPTPTQTPTTDPEPKKKKKGWFW